jgi:hypothetical protein
LLARRIYIVFDRYQVRIIQNISGILVFDAVSPSILLRTS